MLKISPIYFQSTKPTIGFDMGGTSTDVSRFAGSYDHVFETTTAGITIQAPQLDINTVAAGGGSMLFFRYCEIKNFFSDLFSLFSGLAFS